MAPRVYATIGRAADNDVVLNDPTVSNHHARLSWVGGVLLIEDLSSANGTYVDGQRVRSARTRPGADLRFGQVRLPWSHEGLRTLLKAGGGARTMDMPKGRTLSYECGACGHLGKLPEGPRPERIACAGCGATLHVGTRPRRPPRRSGVPQWAGAFVVVSLLAGYGYHTYRSRDPSAPPMPELVKRVEDALPDPSATLHVGGHTAERIAKALTPTDPLTRNTAVKIAAKTEGPFHVEQVAEIWNAVRKKWRYVNDPDGEEYFATATETIENGYVGDCDDFAIALASMVSAIGGKARVVLMDGPKGGHAYTEACVQGEPTKIATALRKHYRTRWKTYLKGKIPKEIAFRTSETCPLWLNLDWNSSVPGGAYEPESWAVAIYPNGKSETLAPAGAKDAPSPPAKGGSTAAP